jgi:hypothetical protein
LLGIWLSCDFIALNLTGVPDAKTKSAGQRHFFMGNPNTATMPKNGESKKAETPEAPKTEAPKNETPAATTPKADSPTPVPPAPILPAVSVKMLTIAEIENKAQLLDGLFQKRARLVTSHAKLEKFNYTSDDSNTNFEFKDTSGNHFYTSNKDVIQKLLKVISDTVTNQIVECDSQIRNVYEN